MKSLENLWSELAREMAGMCHTSADRDIATVASRVEHEGISFLTITLPSFAKDIERCLSIGKFDDEACLGFSRDKSGLPRFLGGFLRQMFDTDGAVRHPSQAMIDSLLAVRQLCALFAKIELRCSPVRELNAIKAYKIADQETGFWEDDIHEGLYNDLTRMSRLLFRDALTVLDAKIYNLDIIPRHGPGAVAERLRGNAKFDLRTWPDRLEAEFSFSAFGIPNPRYHDLVDVCCSVRFPVRDEELPSRVILVPKTMKTPRVIAAEPAALQYMQQAIMRDLVPLLERDPVCGPMVGFTDQEPNRRMARQASIDGSLATLDMSEASDRVSLRQVRSLLVDFPHTDRAFRAVRSEKAELPSGEVLPLRKFASMGSALCFPAEAMCFLSAIFIGIERSMLRRGVLSRRLTRKDILSFHGQVRVYGDDILVPVDCVREVVETFHSLGWKVNTTKSFWSGNFRESCGGDYYVGSDVTPVRIRSLPPTSRRDVSEISSWVSSRNQFYLAGYWKTAGYLDRYLGSLLKHYPVVGPRSDLLGRVTVLDLTRKPVRRMHHDHQVPLEKGWVVRSKIPMSRISDVGALLKCLIQPSEDERHLTHAGRPLAVDIKLTWRPPL